jgi:hypothetical protein
LSIEAGYRKLEIDLNGSDLSKDIEISDGKGNKVDLSPLFNNDKLILYFSDSPLEVRDGKVCLGNSVIR